MHPLSPKQKTHFRKTIWNWYRKHTSDMPWRQTNDPYRILVSELMLQQTQIPRVVLKYRAFLEKFPTLSKLASSPLRNVLKEWQGLGYNRRAVYLWKLARMVEKDFAGKIPMDPSALRSLPGIGTYSSRAVPCFSGGMCLPFIETNIRRVIIHFFFSGDTRVDDSQILSTLGEIAPRYNLRDWYYALMDYGREGMKNIPNPNQRSKHYTKQSRFEGSKRYIRAKALALVLKHKKTALISIFASLQKDKHLAVIKKEQVLIALRSLEKDGFITGKGNQWKPQ